MPRADWSSRLTAAASGAAMALALPGPGLIPLVLLVPGLLRRALVGCHGWRAFRTGWIAGFVQWVLAVPWVYIVLHRYGHVPAPLAALAVMAMAAILGCTWGLAAWGASQVGEAWRPLLLPTALVAVEVLQGLPPWAFPWNPVAAVVTPWPVLLAPLPLIGSAGLSWLLLLAGAGLDGVLDRGCRRSGTAALALGVGGFIVCTFVTPRFEPRGEPIRVAALQPDIPLEYRWDADNLADIERQNWQLNVTAVDRGARWIVWPESAVPRTVERDSAWRAAIERFARHHGAWLLVGSIGFGANDAYFNSVFSVAPGGLTPYRYDKVHLVPFGEYVPLLGRFAFARALIREVGSFTPGASLLPLPSPAGPVGVGVCYEVAFPSLYAGEVRRGAEVLATVTNDGWYGNSAAPRQHLALAVLRAAETRRWLVRAANTGISAIIDPLGRQVERLPVGRRGLIVAEILPSTAVTPAVAGGWWLRGVPVLLALAAILAVVRRQC